MKFQIPMTNLQTSELVQAVWKLELGISFVISFFSVSSVSPW